MHVVHIGLPVLDHTPVISGGHPHAVVAPFHAAHRTVMRLYWKKRGGREGGKKRDGGMEGGMEGGREGGKKRDGGREGGREGRRGTEGGRYIHVCTGGYIEGIYTYMHTVAIITFMRASKLRLIPFQRENSPLAAPAISLLPSGAHYKEGRREAEGGRRNEEGRRRE